jgi:hypothetical protein
MGMIIRNKASGPTGVLKPADNRPQTTVNRPQLNWLKYKPYFIPYLAKKRMIINWKME